MQLRFDWVIVLENLRRGIMVTETTLDGPKSPRIIYVNAAWLKMTGYGRDEIANQTPRMLQGKHTDRAVVGSIKQALKSGGSLCVFEHNPINPVTRKIVSNCIFDEGVELIQKRSLRTLISGIGGFTSQHAGYFLFFPPRLKAFTPLETILSWLPLGGQHFGRFTKSSQ